MGGRSGSTSSPSLETPHRTTPHRKRLSPHRAAKTGAPSASPTFSHACALPSRNPQDEVEDLAFSPVRRAAAHAESKRRRDQFLRDLDTAAWLATTEILRVQDEKIAEERVHMDAVKGARRQRVNGEQKMRLRSTEGVREAVAAEDRAAFKRREHDFILDLKRHVALRTKYLKESRVVAVRQAAASVPGAAQYVADLLK